MKQIVIFLFAFLPGAAVCAHAATTATPVLGRHDNNAPIAIDADKFVANLAGNTRIGTYTGNVVITQGDMKMRADQVRAVADVKSQPQTITATGRVVVDSPSSGTATGDTGVYDVPKRLIVMTGRVVLKHGKDVMAGTHLTYNLTSGIAQIDSAPGAPGVPGTTGGRVHAILTPPPPKDGASTPSSGGTP